MRAHVIENGVVVNTIAVASLDVLPNLVSAENGGARGDTWDGSTFTTPVITPTREQLKAERAAAVAAITVTVTSGKVFDGDEDSQTRMSRAIIGMQAANVTAITWTLADNTSVEVTLTDLTEALILSGQQQAALWPIP